MDSITIGQIGLILAAIVAFVKGVEYLYSLAKKGATNWFKSLLEPINNSINSLSKKIDDVDMNSCKNFLVRFLADVEQGNVIDEIEKERFYEQYKHYVDLGGNSYIKDKVEKLTIFSSDFPAIFAFFL